MAECCNFSAATTLGEAIQIMRTSEAGGDMAGYASTGIEQALEQHDAVHILFNCSTSIEDEIAAHVWMVFATTANIHEMHRAVATREHRNALSGIGHLALLGLWVLSLPRIVSIIFRSGRMKKRVAVEDLARLKEQPIVEIRREHGIVL